MNSPVSETIVIPSNLSRAKALEEQIMGAVDHYCYSENAVFSIKLALEEALTNAIKHGNKNDETKRVTISYSIDNDQVEIYIADEGPGFNPSNIPDPTIDENLEVPSGRGIMLMNAYMNEVNYNRRGNQVRMLKRNE